MRYTNLKNWQKNDLEKKWRKMEKKVTPPLFSTQKRLKSGEKWRKVEKPRADREA